MAYTLKNNTVPLNEEYEVIVCGGGPAGIAAAIAAAREGAKTLLLEGSSMLGGMSTNGMVNMFTNMTDGIRNVYGGIAEKIINRLKSHMLHVNRDEWKTIPIDFERIMQPVLSWGFPLPVKRQKFVLQRSMTLRGVC